MPMMQPCKSLRPNLQMVFPEGRVSLHNLSGEALRSFRPRMSLVFQDPYSSLNPRMTVRDIIAEPLIAGGLMRERAQIDARVREIAARCKLNLETSAPLSARLFGRAAPAYLHCPRAGVAPRFSWSATKASRRLMCPFRPKS